MGNLGSNESVTDEINETVIETPKTIKITIKTKDSYDIGGNNKQEIFESICANYALMNRVKF